MNIQRTLPTRDTSAALPGVCHHDVEDTPMPVEVPSADTLKDIYTRMWRIRLFEEQAEYQSSQGKVMGALHTYIGEEAVAVPVCAHLTDTDYITSTHRGHGHCIAKGADIKRMMAE